MPPKRASVKTPSPVTAKKPKLLKTPEVQKKATSKTKESQSIQQDLLERLVEGLDEKDKKRFQDTNGTFKPINKWAGVSMGTNGNVTEIKWRGMFKNPGKIDLRSLPPSVEAFDASENQICGLVDLTRLPSKMFALKHEKNQLSGPIDLTKLPKGMEMLFLGGNRLSGRLNLNRLPNKMTELFLENNRFDGKLQISKWPTGLAMIDLCGNKFESVSFPKTFPEHMNQFTLDYGAGVEVKRENHSTIRLKNKKRPLFIMHQLHGVCPQFYNAEDFDGMSYDDFYENVDHFSC